MEIGVSRKSLEHVTPRIERNISGWIRSVSLTVGTTEYRYGFGGKVMAASGWAERCTVYADSKWIALRDGTDLTDMLSARAGVDALTAENTRTLERA